MLPLLIPLIAQLAPALIGAVTGSDKVESIATAVIPAIGAAAGINITTPRDATAALEALNRSPEMLAAAQANLVAIETAYLKDRQDARARDIAVRQMNSGMNWEATILMAAIFALLIGICSALIFLPSMMGDTRAFLQSIGSALIPIIAAIAAFHWGSSRGSKEKDASIAASMNQIRPTPISLPISGMEPIVDPGDRRGGFKR